MHTQSSAQLSPAEPLSQLSGLHPVLFSLRLSLGWLLLALLPQQMCAQQGTELKAAPGSHLSPISRRRFSSSRGVLLITINPFLYSQRGQPRQWPVAGTFTA